jgi:hypothetical protein
MYRFWDFLLALEMELDYRWWVASSLIFEFDDGIIGGFIGFLPWEKPEDFKLCGVIRGFIPCSLLSDSSF